MNLAGNNDDEKLESLLKAISQLKDEIEIPHSIKEWGIKEEDFYAKLDDVVEKAFDDQCTGANPVYPLMEDIRQIYIDAYNGVDYTGTKK